MTEDRLAQIIEDNSEVVGHTVPSSEVGEENEAEDVGIDKEVVSDTEARYAKGTSDYTANWTNRESLDYGLYNTLFEV